MDEATQVYLDALTARACGLLGEKITAVYLVGSALGDDYDVARSDLDVLLVVQNELTPGEKTALVQRLQHRALPCPAEGLDLLVMPTGQVRMPPRVPTFELSLVTGKHWEPDVAEGGLYAGALLILAACRAHGQALAGPSSATFIGDIPRGWLEEELLNLIDWHRYGVYDPFHDPTGHNAVLNASRAWAFHATGEWVSKTAGGRWAARHAPEHRIIIRAVEERLTSRRTQLGQVEVNAFLDFVETKLRSG